MTVDPAHPRLIVTKSPSAALRRPILARVTLYLGALSVLATGADHLEQYYVDQYSAVPTIGTLFLLNFISAAVVAAGLLAPLGRLVGRFANFFRALLALSGIGIAITSLIALLVSESNGLFGFMELGYTTPVLLSIAAEVGAVVFLTAFLLANGLGLDAFRARSRKGRKTA